MQIVNGTTAQKMLDNGLNGDDIIRLGVLAGLTHCNIKASDLSFIESLKDKNIYVFTSEKPRAADIVNGYHVKFNNSNAFVSSHLLVLSGDCNDNREYYYQDDGTKKMLTVHK